MWMGASVEPSKYFFEEKSKDQSKIKLKTRE